MTDHGTPRSTRCWPSTPTSSVSSPTRTCTPTPGAARKVGRRFAQISPIVATLPQAGGRPRRPRGRARARRRRRVVRRRGPGARGHGRRARAPSSPTCSPRATRTTATTSCSRSSPGRAARSPRCSPPTWRACTSATPSGTAGRSTVLDETFSDLGGYKDATLSIRSKGDAGRRRVVAAEVRGRRAPRAAGAGHRVAGPRAHLGGRRARLPRTRRGRGGPDRRVRPAHRRLPVVGQGRPGRQHHRLRGADHPPAHRASSSPARTSAPSCRTRPAPCRCSPRGCRRSPRSRRRPTRRPTGPARSAPSTVASASAPTTSRRTGSPTTGSTSRRTTSTRCSTVTSTHCSTRWPPPTSRPGCSRHDAARTTAIDAAAAALAEAGVGSPRADAELLAAHAAGTDRGRLAFADIATDFCERYGALVAQRAKRMPLQHLIGTAAFGPVTVDVGPGVFIPRPETEVAAGMGCRATAVATAGDRRPVHGFGRARAGAARRTGRTPASSPSTTPTTRWRTPGATPPATTSN